MTSPRNLKVKIGTLVKDIIDGCGGLKDGVKKIVVGGPMMGFSQMDLESPITKGTNCILAFTDDEYID
ncbi:MAG: SLBB domain-containing protein, partial [Spirochaetales bacterium]|nr:SLBB domain-containing protein [Spirochaetales bacterium]